MLRIELLPAHQGDALWIEYGEDPSRLSRVLFDAGTPGTWDALQARIAALPPEDRTFELLAVSHVDSDHIGGTLPLLSDTSLGATFGDVWFNGWRHLPQVAEPLGPVQGERLTKLLAGRRWNAAWDGGPVMISAAGAGEVEPLPARTLPGGLRLTLLSPGVEQLARLQPEWEQAVLAAGLVPGELPQEKPPAPSDAEPLGPPPVPAIDLLAAAPFEEDTAAPNGSSIAVLAEYGEAAVLLGADAHPSVVIASVRRLLRERRVERLALSALKLPHHGSRANVSRELLRLVDTDCFLVSSNGAQTRHPHPEAIARVLVEHPRSTLWFNYRSSFTEIWRQDDVIEAYGYTARFPVGEPGIALQLRS